jgi:pimeloyl-ACP methyl ester carboxylesterase
MVDGFWGGLAGATYADLPEPYREADRAVSGDPAHAERMFHLDRELMLTGFADWPDSLVASITVPTLVVAADRDVIRTEHAVLLASVSRTPACSLCLEITATISANSWPQREIPGRSDGHFLSGQLPGPAGDHHRELSELIVTRGVGAARCT